MAELVDALASGASNLTVVEVRVFFRALQVFLDQPSLKAQYHYECANAHVVFSIHLPDVICTWCIHWMYIVNVLFGICSGS